MPLTSELERGKNKILLLQLTWKERKGIKMAANCKAISLLFSDSVWTSGSTFPLGSSAACASAMLFFHARRPFRALFTYIPLQLIEYCTSKSREKMFKILWMQVKRLELTKALNFEAWLLSCPYISIFDLLFTQLFRWLLCGLIIVLLF